MRYTLNAGTLYSEPSSGPLAKIKSSLLGPVKKIYLQDDEPVLKSDICNLKDTDKPQGDVRNRLYILIDRENHRVAEAHPGYAEGEDPEVAGWPICRLPRVDHAQVLIQGIVYTLTMHNSQNYSLRDEKNCEILRIMHRGICGGWVLEEHHGLEPEILCGLFAFCRYIEQENEFLVV